MKSLFTPECLGRALTKPALRRRPTQPQPRRDAAYSLAEQVVQARPEVSSFDPKYFGIGRRCRFVADIGKVLPQVLFKAITTSCGFNGIFQQQLAEAVSVPVFTCSLLQVPFAQRIHGPKSEICILTANALALRPEHLSSVGIARTEGLHILGLEQCQEWTRMSTDADAEIDLAVIEQEVLGTALRALEQHPGIRAFVLECTDLPPYSAAIRRHSGLPVFDFISMVNYLHSSP